MHTETAYDVWKDLEDRYKQKIAPKENYLQYELNRCASSALKFNVSSCAKSIFAL